jgi:hypothetical protein
LEVRCKALSRFINNIARHPVFSHDETVVAFLTHTGDITTHKKGMGTVEPEYTFYKMTEEDESGLPKESEDKLNHIRKILPDVISNFNIVADLLDKIMSRISGAFLFCRFFLCDFDRLLLTPCVIRLISLHPLFFFLS